jgi:hypothetical protein
MCSYEAWNVSAEFCKGRKKVKTFPVKFIILFYVCINCRCVTGKKKKEVKGNACAAYSCVQVLSDNELWSGGGMRENVSKTFWRRCAGDVFHFSRVFKDEFCLLYLKHFWAFVAFLLWLCRYEDFNKKKKTQKNIFMSFKVLWMASDTRILRGRVWVFLYVVTFAKKKKKNIGKFSKVFI